MTRPGRYAPWRGRPAQGARLSRLRVPRAETQGLSPENAILPLFYGTPEGGKESLSPGKPGDEGREPHCAGKSRFPGTEEPCIRRKGPLRSGEDPFCIVARETIPGRDGLFPERLHLAVAGAGVGGGHHGGVAPQDAVGALLLGSLVLGTALFEFLIADL